LGKGWAAKSTRTGTSTAPAVGDDGELGPVGLRGGQAAGVDLQVDLLLAVGLQLALAVAAAADAEPLGAIGAYGEGAGQFTLALVADDEFDLEGLAGHDLLLDAARREVEAWTGAAFLRSGRAGSGRAPAQGLAVVVTIRGRLGIGVLTVRTNQRRHGKPRSQGSRVKGQRSEVRGQRSEVRMKVCLSDF
jgi:hypothetical protein